MIALPNGWHIEIDLEDINGGTPAGFLIISVPGGGWIRPMPALGAGANFCVADHIPPAGCVAGSFADLIWFPEAPELGPWTMTWSGPAAGIGVDSSVVEMLLGGIPHAPTPFDFEIAPVPGPDDVLVVVEEVPGTPLLGTSGSVALVLALLATAGIVIARQRQAEPRVG